MHRRAIVIDGHNDLPWRLLTKADSSFDRFDLAVRHDDGHTDIPRLREGGVDAQFFAAYVPSDREGPGASRIALEQIDLVRRMVARYSDFELAYSAADVRRIAGKGKIAALIGVEGGQAIENSVAVLRTLYALGARYLTFTHIDSTDWADAATDEPRHGGLSEFGEEVVREMNRLGMLVDISHVSAETMADALRVSEAPVVATHSGARAVNANSRNVPDDILRQLRENGGLVMVNFYSGFVVPEAAKVARDILSAYREARARFAEDGAALESYMNQWEEEHPIPPGTVSDLVDHIDHIVEVAGIDHAGLGSDFDGIINAPEGLEDVSKFPAITEELLRRGYSESDIVKILGGNILRAMEGAEEVARRLSAAAP
ncbi:MAG: membrane dipeptidase [Gemmatimonadetes bacterium]|nr:membrane dipeptidase [Gemmatimonadota bacterium]NIO32066.1 membrane dipeptidase [Gemmatimonadota bacterium]